MKSLECPSTAILDGDIIAYRAALLADTADDTFIPAILEEMLEFWLPIEANDFQMALSCSRKDNFRREIWPNYKKNRESKHEPDLLKEVKDYIRDVYNCLEAKRIEADDIMGIYAEESIAVTIDKDLRGVPGWHYNPFKEDFPTYVSKDEAEEFFCIQWMTGDSTDCIPGLWRVGPKRAKSFLKKWGECDRHEKIIELYCEDRYQPKDSCDLEGEELALVMARCVRILSAGCYDNQTEEISLWNP